MKRTTSGENARKKAGAGKAGKAGKRSAPARTAAAASKGSRANAVPVRGKNGESGPEITLAGGPGIRDGRGSDKAV